MASQVQVIISLRVRPVREADLTVVENVE
jgi:hypothetical protein